MNLYEELEQLKADLNRVVVKAHEVARIAGRMESGEVQNVPNGSLILRFQDVTTIRNYAERLLNHKGTEGVHFSGVMMAALEQLEKLQKERAELQDSLGNLSKFINTEAGK